MTPAQCRMARAALSLSVIELASQAGVSKNTVTNFEAGNNVHMATVAKLRDALEASGLIRFEGLGGVFYQGELITPGLAP